LGNSDGVGEDMCIEGLYKKPPRLVTFGAQCLGVSGTSDNVDNVVVLLQSAASEKCRIQ
jgi:hypothetical protein